MKNKHLFNRILIFTLFYLPISMLNAQDNATKFYNPILIPDVIRTSDYFLRVDSTNHNFNPFEPGDSLNTLVKTFAFNEVGNEVHSILGPTIFWQFESEITARVQNNLNEETTVHWHGAHVPVAVDGGPHQRIQPSQIWEPPVFPVLDRSASMWYHPHAMGLTYEHVQMGLSGMLIAEDPGEADSILHGIHNRIPHIYAVNDFPLIFQTKRFDRQEDGSLAIRSSFPGYKDNYTYMVNGRKDPYVTVPKNQVRLRILNGDAKFAFNFGVGDRNFNSIGFNLIATDAGYTEESYALDSILMGPGERTEWIVDLRSYNIGDTVFIFNKASSIPKSIIGGPETTNNYAQDRLLLALVIGANNGPEYNLDFPVPLHPSEAPPLSQVSNIRTKVFRQDPFFIEELNRVEMLYNIDSVLMDMMVVNDVILKDSTEIWTIVNTSNRAHPFHIHDIHFWVTEIIDEQGNSLHPDDYPSIFKGPKDNVMVMPGWKLSFITTFADYATPVAPQNSYMYHCHILPHEDRGMMGQFVVTDLITSTNEIGSISTRTMKLYPNPTLDYFFLEGGSQSESSLRITDLSGRILKQLKLSPFEGAVRLDISELNAGIIFIQWFSEEGQAISKLQIKQ